MNENKYNVVNHSSAKVRLKIWCSSSCNKYYAECQDCLFSTKERRVCYYNSLLALFML